MKRLFYHLQLNLAWMQTNQAQQFLFVGVCGCPKSVEGQGSILINTLPKGRCNFCNEAVEMIPLLARDQAKHQWLELYKNEEGKLATRRPSFTTGAAGSSPESTPAIHTS